MCRILLVMVFSFSLSAAANEVAESMFAPASLKCFAVDTAYDFPKLDAKIYFANFDTNFRRGELMDTQGVSLCANDLNQEGTNEMFVCDSDLGRFEFVIENFLVDSPTYANEKQYLAIMRSPKHFFGGGDVLQTFSCLKL